MIPGPGAIALNVARLTKAFPGQLALDDVSFDVARGNVHGLLGENGSGKSTLIRVLAGYHVPEPGGSVAVGGEVLPFGSPVASRALGLRFVHQNLGLIDKMTVVENLALGSGYVRRASGRIDWVAQRSATRDLLALTGVALDPGRLVGGLRAVERTAVAIARALDRSGGAISVLVLDEPTAALPPTEVERLFEVVREVRNQGISVLYVSHRLDEIFALVDRVTVLRDGRVVDTEDVAALDRNALVSLIVGVERGNAPQSSLVHRVAPVPAAAKRPRLEVEGLSAKVLDNVSLTLGAGEILGVGGLVGSGREEVPYALFGAIPATMAHLVVEGVSLRAVTPDRALSAGLALVPGNRQAGSAIGSFTLRENLTLATMRRYAPGHWLHRRREVIDVDHWIKMLQIQPPEPERFFSAFSGGNQQKILLAKWLNTNPSVMLLDEPTAGVDVGARQVIYNLIRAEAARGTSFLIASSDVEDLASLCHRVVIVARGRSTCELSSADVAEDRILEAMLSSDRSRTVVGTL